jgi:hypothetical protein
MRDVLGERGRDRAWLDDHDPTVGLERDAKCS